MDEFNVSQQQDEAHRSARIFLSIELPSTLRASITQHIAQLREIVPAARASWERPEKLHVTIKFLGEVAEPRIRKISNAASLAVSDLQPFVLRLEGAGTFPARGFPRILWLGINAQGPELSRLHAELEMACESFGFDRDTRPFHPHVTIARIRLRQGAQELTRAHEELGFVGCEFPVSELMVMRSELGPTGSLHSVISRHPITD